MNLKARIFPVFAAILCTTMAAPAEVCSAAVKPTVDLNRAVVRSVASYYCQSYLSTSGSTAYCSSYARGANNTTRIVISLLLHQLVGHQLFYSRLARQYQIFASARYLPAENLLHILQYKRRLRNNHSLQQLLLHLTHEPQNRH